MADVDTQGSGPDDELEPEEDLDSEEETEEEPQEKTAEEAMEDAEEFLIPFRLFELLSKRQLPYGYRLGYFSALTPPPPLGGSRAFRQNSADAFLYSYKGRHESPRIILNRAAVGQGGAEKIRKYKRGENLIKGFVRGEPSVAPAAELD